VGVGWVLVQLLVCKGQAGRISIVQLHTSVSYKYLLLLLGCIGVTLRMQLLHGLSLEALLLRLLLGLLRLRALHTRACCR
jgi:hypothetical protein